MIRRVHVSRIAPDAEIGDRVQVMGNSGSGKSTLGARLAEALDAPFVELDALNWLPGWVGLNQTDPDRFERRIREATRARFRPALGPHPVRPPHIAQRSRSLCRV